MVRERAKKFTERDSMSRKIARKIPRGMKKTEEEN